MSYFMKPRCGASAMPDTRPTDSPDRGGAEHVRVEDEAEKVCYGRMSLKVLI